MTGPKHDGKYLHNLLKEKLGELRLHNSLTNVVIPAFDIKLLQPVLFSSYKVLSFHQNNKRLKERTNSETIHNQVLSILFVLQLKENPALNAKMADVCIGTSAAPTFLPAHYFENRQEGGVKKEFHLIDGGIVANNPVK